jgi:AcrR family transcriptional regulator
MHDETKMRREPQQIRSLAKVDLILEAAAEMIGEVGYEGLSTSKLATRVGISVGTLYQFFANKEAILQALAERYLIAMRLKIDSMFPPDAIYAPLPILVGRAVDLLAANSFNLKALHELMESGWVSPAMRGMSAAMNAEIISKIEAILAHKAPDLAESQRQTAAIVMMHLVKGVLNATEGQVEPTRTALVEEFKRVGVLYMESVIAHS